MGVAYRVLSIFISLSLVANTSALADSGYSDVVNAESMAAIEESVELAVTSPNSEEDSYSIKTKKGNVYSVPKIRETDGQVGPFNQLSNQQQEDFQKNRLFFLNLLASFLEHGNLATGVGSIVKGKLKRVFQRAKAKFVSFDSALDNDWPLAEQPQQTVRERAKSINQKLIEAIDTSLWARANIVAIQNEFGVSVGTSPSLLAGLGSRGAGGSVGVAFNFGYNKTQKAVVFEVVAGVDKFEYAITPSLSAGNEPKIGVYMRSNIEGREMETRRGRSVGAPMFPGYITESPSSFTIGFSSTSLSVIPVIGVFFLNLVPVIGDFMSYTTTGARKPVIRITASPVSKYFMRLNFLGKQTIGTYYQQVKNVFKEVSSLSEWIWLFKNCSRALRPMGKMG